MARESRAESAGRPVAHALGHRCDGWQAAHDRSQRLRFAAGADAVALARAA
jgi:hypothetical protein